MKSRMLSKVISLRLCHCESPLLMQVTDSLKVLHFCMTGPYAWPVRQGRSKERDRSSRPSKIIQSVLTHRYMDVYVTESERSLQRETYVSLSKI
jgi:hypothetical protein